jgi:G:T-mismatch repair DNA endonuclease (very short patch repair protein)
LTGKGWQVISIWECEATNLVRLAHLLSEIRNRPIQPRHARISPMPGGGTDRREGAF